MRVRKARKADFQDILRLAKKYDLDYTGMEADGFFVAAEDGRILGICGLKKHPECLELCALGVEEDYRGRGWGARLVRTALGEVPGEVYLATVIPGFFLRLGFQKAKTVPPSMVKRGEWCAGCTPELCSVLVRQGGR
jgi:N-acetylglutamate synthase-like GNAT family acetyltransferase